MIYVPNTTRWPVGSLVIHDADAKDASMLMRVTGYDHDGRCRTRYERTQVKAWRKILWRNDIAVLHDPQKFGIEVAFCK